MTVLQDGVRAVTGRNGEAQYELKVRWEWTPASNTWGDTTYVNKDICPDVITAGTHTVLARRDELKANKEKVTFDGSLEWMYRWRIVEWEGIAAEGVTTAPPQAAPAPAPQPTPQAPVAPPPQTQSQPVVQSRPIDENQMRIMRQATLKCASWMMVPLVVEYDANFDDGPIKLARATEELSELFMQYVITGKVYEDIPEDAEDLLNEEF
tara:strand:+ start:1478 stop:2104 length:627 start_codon:yes stop_codon:yes gene_type:complete